MTKPTQKDRKVLMLQQQLMDPLYIPTNIGRVAANYNNKIY